MFSTKTRYKFLTHKGALPRFLEVPNSQKFVSSFWYAILCLFLYIFLFPNNVLGFNPNLPNNKFGIHLAVGDRADIVKAAELVNSSGGEWGYVTLVIQENDRDKKKWQSVFDQMRSLKLIPIIRLATQPQGGVWEAPSIDDIGGWIDFLDSLNWVVKDRYIILFNEPNHATEWGGKIDPEDYANVAYEFAKRLKEKDENYFIMLSGFDASAPQSAPNYADEETFLTKMFKSENRNPKSLPAMLRIALQAGETNYNFKNLNFENCFEFSASPGTVRYLASCFEFLIDGWASHSYPNPAYQGSPYDRGKGTISTYDWELSYLKSLGIQNDLPVFITETGWPHSENISSSKNVKFPNSSVVGQNIISAYESIWLNDQRVRAVTPFVLNYQTDPFLGFSWKKQGVEDFYDQFKIVKNVNKVKGEPEQIHKASVITDLPSKILVSSSYKFKINIKNTGQSIFDSSDGYELKLENISKRINNYFFSDIDAIAPNNEGSADLFLKTSDKTGKETINISFFKGDKKITKVMWDVAFEPLPDIDFKINLFPKLDNSASDIEIQIFDKDEKLVFKKSGVIAIKGKGKIDNIKNIYLGGKYRVVILIPYYLPRQKYLVFDKKSQDVKFDFLIPFDFDKDGNFDFQDIWALIKKPGLFSLFRL